MRLDMPSPYLPKGYTTYYIRKAVPARLREAVGKSELKRSLGTRDPQKAKRRAPIVAAELQRILDDTEKGHAFGRSDVQALAAQYREERRKHWLDIAARDGWGPDRLEWRFDELHAVVEEEWDEYRQFGEGDPNSVAAEWGKPRLDRFLARHHESIPGPWRTAAAVAFYVAERHAVNDARHELFGDVDAPPAPAVEAKPRARSLSKLFEEYATARQLDQRTRDHWSKLVQHFERWLDGKPAHAVEQSDLYRYADHLREHGGTGNKPLATKTINESYLASIKQTFGFAHKRGRLSSNPALGVSLKPTRAETMRDQVRAYSDAEVVRLLEFARRQKTPYKRWAPWLAAFTGARISEILNATKADVGEAHGVHFLSIQPDERRSLKTADSRRRVPLHPALIDEGFLDYVSSIPKGEYLFPGNWKDKHGNRTKTPANRLREMLRKALPQSDGKVSPNHSFRHWLSAALRKHGVGDDLARELSGHKAADIHAAYGRGDLPTLDAGIRRLVSPIEPGQPQK